MATYLHFAVHLMAASLAAPEAPRPNIVWVMADDLGWGEVGLFPSNSSVGRIDTPHLDKFGREGVIFTEAYAGYTVCAPSRTTFFTGRHSGRFVHHGWTGKALSPGQNVTTLAHVLQRAGYQTGAFGKIAPLTSPLEQGFDSFMGQVDQKLCHNMYPPFIDAGNATLNLKLVGNHGRLSRDLCMQDPGLYNYTIDVFHEAGMAWLEVAVRRRAPFFLYLSFTIPHAGGWTGTGEKGNPVPTDLQYAGKPWPDVEKDHAAVITYLDGKVGDLMARLKALGVDDNTLVFFASDNGAHKEGGHKPEFFNSTGGLRGHKRSLYEGGVRSPTMVRWPAFIKGGQRSTFAWAFWDMLPTFADLAGESVVGTSDFKDLDGISIVPMLLGHSEQAAHEYLYFTWSATTTVSGYAVRQGRWKGVVPFCADSEGLQPSMEDNMEIYDLSADPFETSDVAAHETAVVTALKKLVISKNVSCVCYQCDIEDNEGDVDIEEILV